MRNTLVVFALLAGGLVGAATPSTRPYVIVGTGQTQCYNNVGVIAPPKPGQPFYGQDAQCPGPAPKYRDNGDGTITDLNTGLMWVRARGPEVSWTAAVKGASACHVGGYRDWRMPTIKELYSLINFDGGCTGREGSSRPYLDTRYFEFVYGNAARGERIIDCQDWSGTQYVGKTMRGSPTVFGVNFADGRIKGYPKVLPSGRVVTKYVRYVRGNPAYGKNDFHDNGDGTITDRATGLMWQKADSGTGMNWEQALAYAAGCKLAGYSDWRLPNAKELQSIVDYTRAPSVTMSPAISPLFQVTRLRDGDYPFFWTSTTHLDGPPEQQGRAAVYIAFGRALGWMPVRQRWGPATTGPRFGRWRPGMRPPRFRAPGTLGRLHPRPAWFQTAGAYQLLDVHGAGAQRSDPKAGDPRMFPHGRGPQGDVVRIYNFVRLVRGG